tara:strand:+ start:107 stop:262 length:156 start_codon:yes stop_codon:yes gene_type:complete
MSWPTQNVTKIIPQLGSMLMPRQKKYIANVVSKARMIAFFLFAIARKAGGE